MSKYQKGDNFQIFKNYSYIDFVIYDHFNHTFWKKVKEQGEDFYGEVDQFKLVQMLVNQFCFVGYEHPLNGSCHFSVDCIFSGLSISSYCFHRSMSKYLFIKLHSSEVILNSLLNQMRETLFHT
jgi:hypothetical protein